MIILVILVTAALKLFYMNGGNSSVVFMLKPVDRIVSLATNTESVYSSKVGFFNESLNIIINKSCSGFNFMLICFVMISVFMVKNLNKLQLRKRFIPLILILSYTITLFVNSSRILFALYLNKFKIIGSSKISWLHQAQGVFVYLFFLILLYLIMDNLLFKRRKKDEKNN